jgi:hypothetical protein
MTGVATGFAAGAGVAEADGLGAAGVAGDGGGTSSYGLAGVALGIGAVVAPPAVGVQHVTGCVQQTGWQQALARRHLTGLQQHLRRAWASLPESAKNMTTQMIAAKFLMVQPRGPCQ